MKLVMHWKHQLLVHISNVIRYSQLCILGEDPLCSDSVDLADSIFDHLDYLGHYERDGKPFGC